MSVSNDEIILKSMTIVSRRGFYGTKGENQNKPFYVIDVLVPLSEEEQRSNFIGYKLKNIFLTKEQWVRIQPEDIGKQVVFEYDTDDFGTPVVKDFKLIGYLKAEAGKEAFGK